MEKIVENILVKLYIFKQKYIHHDCMHLCILCKHKEICHDEYRFDYLHNHKRNAH